MSACTCTVRDTARRRAGRVFFCAALALLGSGAAAAVSKPADFAYGRSLQLDGAAPVYALSLPPELYAHLLRADAGDLRVFNAAGEPVPHRLLRPAAAQAVPAPWQRLPLFAMPGDSPQALDALRIRVETTTTSSSLALQTAPSRAPLRDYLLDARALTAPLTALQLQWPAEAAEFNGRVDVEVSEDLRDWRRIVDAAPLLNLHQGEASLRETRIHCAPTRARYWRLHWHDGAWPVPLSAAQVQPAPGTVEVLRNLAQYPGQAVLGLPGVYDFDLTAQRPVDRLNLVWPQANTAVHASLYSRASPETVWQRVVSGDFYRLRSRVDAAAGEIANRDLPIEVNRDRYWQLRLSTAPGADSESAAQIVGAAAPRLQIAWLADDLQFIARGAAPFTLAYGSARIPAAPVADAAFAAVLAAAPQAVGTARVGRETALGGTAVLQPPAPPRQWATPLLWAVLLAGVAVLAGLVYRTARAAQT